MPHSSQVTDIPLHQHQKTGQGQLERMVDELKEENAKKQLEIERLQALLRRIQEVGPVNPT